MDIGTIHYRAHLLITHFCALEAIETDEYSS